jgi:hypothetical protein
MGKLVAVGILVSGAILALTPVNASQTPKEPAKTKVDDERAKNDAAYEQEFLWQKETLFQQHPGEWIYITGGEVSKTFASVSACAEEADKKFPGAAHRYVFRIGEDGLVRYDVTTLLEEGQPKNLLGNGFRSLLEITLEEVDDGLVLKRHGKSRTFKWQRASHVRGVELLDPLGSESLTIDATLSGSNSILLVDTPTAGRLRLARFEIPGSARIDSGDGAVRFRRARVRIRLPEIDVDDMIPVAIWPR